MKKFKVKIKGISPLLQAKHPTPDEEAAILKRASKAGSRIKKQTDDEQYEIHSYKTKNGKFFQPGEMFEAAMIKAASAHILKGRTSYRELFKAAVFVDEVEIIHKKQNFYPHGVWGKNPSTGGAIWVVRPRIDEWELEFTINLLLDEKIADDVVEEVLKYAGLFVGIGAWRPKFGRFEVSEFKLIK